MQQPLYTVDLALACVALSAIELALAIAAPGPE